jgi:hypothetical protein
VSDRQDLPYRASGDSPAPSGPVADLDGAIRIVEEALSSQQVWRSPRMLAVDLRMALRALGESA